jgi:hypothetical protein
VPLVEQIARLTGGALAPTDLTCVERGPTRELRFTMSGRTFTATLRGDTDWVDVDPLLACLNEALGAGGANGSLEFAEGRGIIFAPCPSSSVRSTRRRRPTP